MIVIIVAGLLLYIGVLLVLVQVNVYVALGYLFVVSILMKIFSPHIKGYVGERRIRQLLEKLGGGIHDF